MKYRTPSPIHFKDGESEYYGCETLTPSWFPWLGEFPCLGGGGAKYYGCDIWNPPTPILKVGIQNIMVERH
jgi:hypothetical protein